MAINEHFDVESISKGWTMHVIGSRKEGIRDAMGWRSEIVFFRCEYAKPC